MRPELIIFDCDGVLIDSETIAASVVARNLTALGWPMTVQDSMQSFLGMSITDMEPMIIEKLGRLPEHWRRDLAAELVEALGTQATLIPGARETLEAVNALGIPWRIASNSSDEEMRVKFANTGLSDLTAGLSFSASAVIAKGGRAKPAPDIFAAAAASARTAPSHCLVLEDSALGVTGAVAAGMTCYGFAPHGDGGQLTAAGASRIMKSLNQFVESLSP
jgi:beta-phosphoglucomutase-like phosphatase (HAD superfamily)